MLKKISRQRRLLPVTLGVALGVLAGASCAAGPAWADLQPGAYTMVVSIDMGGAQQPQQHTIEDCLTPEEAANPGDGLLRSLIDKERCTITNKAVSASHMSADFNCSIGTNTHIGHVNMTFADTSIIGRTEIKIMSGDTLVNTMNTDIKADRTGDCKQPTATAPSSQSDKQP